jgi:glucose-1-phosphate thymidylyltransferase
MPVQAVILTAGEGTRLRPLTASRVKGMITIANKPILEYVINALAQNNIRDIIMVVGYKKERIMAYFEDGTDFNVKIQYVDQKKQLGTGHALMQAQPLIKDRFIVLPGDNIIAPDGISKLLEKNQADASMLLTRSDNPSKYGVVGMVGNTVEHIVEKPEITGDLLTKGVPSIFSLALWEHQEKSISNIISTGIYQFKRDVFKILDNIMAEQKYSLTELIQYMITNNMKVTGLKTKTWADAVYPWDILDMNAVVLQEVKMAKRGRIEHGAIIRPPVDIGEDTVIRSNSYIMGPVVIGSGCEIGPNAVIMPSTSIGNNVTINPFTEIRHSIVMDDCRIGSSSMVSHSVISTGSTVGSNFIAESVKQEIKLKTQQYEIKNIGSIIGEDSIVGHNVVFIPGIIVGANCKISSLKELHENVPDNTTVM